MTATDVEIRPFRREDAAAAADVLRTADPNEVVNAARVEHWLDRTPERARYAVWVAECDGRIVGWADAELDWDKERDDLGQLSIAVLPEYRGRGIGAALYDAAEAHVRAVGAGRIRAGAIDAAGRAFADARGFEEVRRERLSSLDTRGADLRALARLEEEKRAEGFRLVSLRELLDRERDLYAMFDETQLDMPSDEERASLPFDEWREETLENPLLDADASMNVLHGERPVAFTWLLVDHEGGRAEHELTGTLRAYRGRGLARLAKLAAVRWCAANGIHTIVTGNDSENVPMLAINDRLGYRPTHELVVVGKDI